MYLEKIENKSFALFNNTLKIQGTDGEVNVTELVP